MASARVCTFESTRTVEPEALGIRQERERDLTVGASEIKRGHPDPLRATRCWRLWRHGSRLQRRRGERQRQAGSRHNKPSCHGGYRH
jgi:hypothetical protein